jgi:hypothetical protein
MSTPEGHWSDAPSIQDPQADPAKADEPVVDDFGRPVVEETVAPRWPVFAEVSAIVCAVASFGLGVRHLAVDSQPFRYGYLFVLGAVSASVALVVPVVFLVKEGPGILPDGRLVRLLVGATMLGFIGFLLLWAGDTSAAGG